MSSTLATKNLLNQLKQAGVELRIEDGKLRYNAPKGVMNDDVLQELKTRKAEIIEQLSAAAEEPALRKLPRTNTPGELPLSYAQQRIWFLDELEPENPFYNVTLAKRVRGEINTEVLQQSLLNVVNRHEVLRSYCETVNDQAVLIINNEIGTTENWFFIAASTSSADIRRFSTASSFCCSVLYIRVAAFSTLLFHCSVFFLFRTSLIDAPTVKRTFSSTGGAGTLFHTPK